MLAQETRNQAPTSTADGSEEVDQSCCRVIPAKRVNVFSLTTTNSSFRNVSYVNNSTRVQECLHVNVVWFTREKGGKTKG